MCSRADVVCQRRPASFLAAVMEGSSLFDYVRIAGVCLPQYSGEDVSTHLPAHLSAVGLLRTRPHRGARVRSAADARRSTVHACRPSVHATPLHCARSRGLPYIPTRLLFTLLPLHYARLPAHYITPSSPRYIPRGPAIDPLTGRAAAASPSSAREAFKHPLVDMRSCYRGKELQGGSNQRQGSPFLQ